jgi:hypothetical protein
LTGTGGSDPLWLCWRGIERLILRTLLVAFDRHNLDTLAQDRRQLRVSELIDVAK